MRAIMGTFRFTGTNVNLVDFTLDGVIGLPVVTSTSTNLTLGSVASGFTLTAIGTGFVYVRSGGRIVDVTAGTLSSFSVEGIGDLSGLGLAWTNLNLSMATLANSFFAENWPAFRGYMFSRADTVIGTSGADALASFGGNDVVFGGAGADELIGALGNDKLYGGTGADNLRGGSNNDTLFGGLGADQLRGGGNSDVFVFNTGLGSTQRDTITDFVAVDDVIHLDNAIFTAFTTLGTMLATRFHVGVAARDAGDRIIYDRAEGVLSYDRDGTGSAAAVIFALVDPGTALGYQDIVII
jgi:Ca2+-binding RTX toxin-like protein